jgi:hypothetical protein
MDEIPIEFGVMAGLVGKLNVIRAEAQRLGNGLPFAVWMALAKAVPVQEVVLEERESLVFEHDEALHCNASGQVWVTDFVNGH